MKNRRIFLKTIASGIISFFIYSWYKLTLRNIETLENKQKVFAFTKNKTVLFNDPYIIVNQTETTTVFSARCTHLGCKINKMEDGHLVCPCHGSVYDLNGKVIKGPAYKNLQTIDYQISEDGKQIIVKG